MRVCDACYLGGTDPLNVVVSAQTHKTDKFGGQNAPKVWEGSAAQGGLPEFCDECFELFKAKNWADLGLRQQNSMVKLLQQGGRASDTP